MKNKSSTQLSDEIIHETGITSEVLTLTSKITFKNILDSILEKKSRTIYNCIKDIENEILSEKSMQDINSIAENNDKKIFKNKKIDVIIIGTYLTGIGIADLLSREKDYRVTLIDIYPHFKEFINLYKLDFKIENQVEIHNNKIIFSNDLNKIYSGDIVIDTTGLGGISPKQAQNIKSKVFIIEDPIAEDNDILLKQKNNIFDRINRNNSSKKFILKTKGLNTKTSGTMTLSVNVLKKSLDICSEREGVLYSVVELGFYEEVLFKEKNIKKFIKLINTPVLKVSTIIPFNCDEVINHYLNKADSNIVTIKDRAL